MSSTAKSEAAFLSGDEALAQGAWEEGLRVACAYPGTPSTEILEYLAKKPEVDSQWSVNEKVAYEVALGASVGGLRSLYASKHVGVNVAMDPLMTSAYTGVGAGFLVVTCDDPGLHSSQNEQDNRLIAAFAKVPLIEPSSPAEAKAWVGDCFALSERFDTPVMIRMTTRLAHTKENVTIGVRREAEPPPFKVNPAKYVMVPRAAYARHILLEEKLVTMEEEASRSRLNVVEKGSDKLGLITSGVTYLYVREMFPDASILKLGWTQPFPVDLVRRFATTVKELQVIEELEPFLEDRVRMLGLAVRRRPRSWRIGELRPELLPDLVQGREKVERPSTARKPVMCPGCPHRLVFYVLKKLHRVVAGDIGCYTLGSAPPLSSLHTCVCMGAGVTMFEGLAKSLGKKVVGVIGDSTFVHSGITGLINLVYNGATGVVVILDNGTTAMTGNQPHPGTGETIKGKAAKKLVIEDICRAAGADNVEVIDPTRVKEFEQMVKLRLEEEKLTVIIARSPCRLLGHHPKPPPDVDHEKCKRCQVCLSIDCPAITRLDDGRINIDEKLCTGCNLCAEACPFAAMEKRHDG